MFFISYSYNYQLCSIMEMDEFGEGQVISKSLLDKNWHSFIKMWIMYRRETLLHYKNDTNNRLES